MLDTDPAVGIELSEPQPIGLPKQVETAGESARWASFADRTAPVEIRLLTPRAAQAGLRLLGLEWEPAHRASMVEPFDRAAGAGLYAWVAGAAEDPLARGVLYWGIGRGAGGVDGRLDYEYSAVRPEYDHGHGMAVGRLSATAVRSPVWTTLSPQEVQQRAEVLVGPLPKAGQDRLRAFLGQLVVGPAEGPQVDLAMVERFVIRLAIQVGQTGAPVQSQHATAWANTSGADWAAYAVRRRWERDAG